ncbi:hypothetical protein NX059_006139 [Plenodomus lindquistii]|nr:hypothetical protein NX059_006139 [Plenodomus lindquistii]
MCVAELCVTVQSCQHRWFHLVRPCSPSSNLSTCSRKLGLVGWEKQLDYCPYCNGNVSEFEYRLIGNGPAPPVGSLSGLARSHSVSLNTTRAISRTDSASSVGSKCSLVTAASVKNRAMNNRLDAYFFPSNDQPYPAVREDDEDSNVTRSPSDISSNDNSSVRRDSVAEPYKVNMLSRVRRRTKRISGIFR